MMVTYYVTLFASLFINCVTHHLLCLYGMYVTTYVTPTMTSLMWAIKMDRVGSKLMLEANILCIHDMSLVEKGPNM